MIRVHISEELAGAIRLEKLRTGEVNGDIVEKGVRGLIMRRRRDRERYKIGVSGRNRP